MINREASSTYKGYRYQKIRLAKRVLELIYEDDQTNIIAIPEFRDDNFFINKEGEEVLEQDKEYSKNFSFNSEEIVKSFINFLDQYIELGKPSKMVFVFFTNVDYVKERSTERIKELGLTIPKNGVIKALIDKDYSNEVLEYIKKFLISNYKDAYGIKEEDIENKEQKDIGHYNEIKRFSNDDWKTFLQKIEFQFGQDSLSTIMESYHNEIRRSRFFNASHINSIESISSILLDKIDERMAYDKVFQKIINTDMVKNIFYESEKTGTTLRIDSVYENWNEIEESLGEDKFRNIEEKIRAVCSSVKSSSMKRFNNEATTVRAELKNYDKNQIKALRYRVYESMERTFDDKVKYKNNYAFGELKAIVSELKESAVKDIESLKQDYDYGINNKIVIEKIVMLLIDECFFCFEEEVEDEE
ncbi:MAG: hypothetical protein Q4F05_02525 [bacterium]|nr:hypothetical protein [bacterium]